jgi:hypothetical protein
LFFLSQRYYSADTMLCFGVKMNKFQLVYCGDKYWNVGTKIEI